MKLQALVPISLEFFSYLPPPPPPPPPRRNVRLHSQGVPSQPPPPPPNPQSNNNPKHQLNSQLSRSNKRRSFKVCYLPKSGEKVSQDSYGISPTRVAIADGVSNSYEGGKFASILVSKFIGTLIPDDKLATHEGMKHLLEEVVKEWETTVMTNRIDSYILQQMANEVGGATTFLGVIFSETRCTFIHIGDTFYIEVKIDDNGRPESVYKFPYQDSNKFTRSPDVIFSKKEYISTSLKNLKIETREISENTIQILGTDGLPLLLDLDGETLCTYILKAIDDVEQGISWHFQKLQSMQVIPNDDITFIVIYKNSIEDRLKSKLRKLKKYL